MPNEIIPVNTGRSYDIFLEKGALSRVGELALKVSRCGKAVIVTDSNVSPLYGSLVRQSLEATGFTAAVFAFAAGESSKNHRTLLDIYTFLAEQDFTRSDLIVALGGGVVGDVAGYAAATWQRGVGFIQIPTTLLAQVDSSVGGKTGVDLPQGKNLVGAFWQPKMVICDPDALATLDARNVACGMAEIIKHACIRSASLFSRLDGGSVTPEIIGDNIRIKRDVVEKDERETGERMLLNFGHTLGHAIEKLHQFEGVTHGEAVACGMALAAEYGERNGLSEPGTARAVHEMLCRYGLPVETELPLGEIVEAALNDKKRSGELLNLILLRRIGEAFIHRLPVTEMHRFFGL